MLLFYIYIFTQFYLQGIYTADFNYKNTCEWIEKFPICGGPFQSPINIRLLNFQKSGGFPPLKWSGYENVPAKMSLKNSGHSIVLTGQWHHNHAPFIAYGPLTDAYIFEQLHFHWGPNNSVGSEHQINGISFPLEMHMVHYKRQYMSFANATNYRDGLAVVGIFYDINTKGSDALTTVLGGLAGVQSPKETFELDPFELSSFNAATASMQFSTYAGSLTTPPCSQSVIWILPLNILSVSSKQMEKFRSIKLNHGVKHNYRPTQPINGRSVYIFTQWSKLYMSDVYKLSGGT